MQFCKLLCSCLCIIVVVSREYWWKCTSSTNQSYSIIIRFMLNTKLHVADEDTWKINHTKHNITSKYPHIHELILVWRKWKFDTIKLITLLFIINYYFCLFPSVNLKIIRRTCDFHVKFLMHFTPLIMTTPHPLTHRPFFIYCKSSKYLLYPLMHLKDHFMKCSL